MGGWASLQRLACSHERFGGVQGKHRSCSQGVPHCYNVTINLLFILQLGQLGLRRTVVKTLINQWHRQIHVGDAIHCDIHTSGMHLDAKVQSCRASPSHNLSVTSALGDVMSMSLLHPATLNFLFVLVGLLAWVRLLNDNIVSQPGTQPVPDPTTSQDCSLSQSAHVASDTAH